MPFKNAILYRLAKSNFSGFPKMLKIEQKFSSMKVNNITQSVYDEIDSLSLRDLKGKKIAITAGSRGIPNYGEVVRAIGTKLKELGAIPFVVPAMGSHGGGTAEGQNELLKSYGVTEESLQMPIVSSMDTIVLGISEQGVEVHCDKNAYEADGIVLCNRIKPHTDFRGIIESGLCKMMVVGLGKYNGATSFHKTGSGDMETRLLGSAKLFLTRTKVLFGIALIDNAYHQTKRVEAVLAQNIFNREPSLLVEASKSMSRILINDIDTLIVDYFGKEISGCGMDPNVTGRFIYTDRINSSDYPNIKKIVLMRTTKLSHGNASGMGVADFISNKFAQSLDLGSTYTNCLNSRYSLSAKIPMVMNNDFDTVYAAASSCGKANIKDVRIVRIHNTLELEEIWVSENYMPEILANPLLEIIEGPKEMEFNKDNNFIDLS